MNRVACVGYVLYFGVALTTAAQDGAELEKRFQQGIYAMETRGEYHEAIAIFDDVADAADPDLAGRALLVMGTCYEKLGIVGAERIYERIVAEFNQQEVLVQEASARLRKLRATGDATAGRRQFGGGHLQLVLPGDQIRVNVWRGGAPYDVSPDGKRIVFEAWLRSDSDEKPGLWLTDPSGAAAHPLLTPTERLSGFRYPRWSPDGQSIAFVVKLPTEKTSKGRLHRWTMAISDLSAQKIQLVGRIQREAPTDIRWRPDGSALTYISMREEGLNSGIHTIDFDGRTLRHIPLAHPGNAWVGGYSPDGRWLVYSTSSAESGLRTDTDLWLYDWNADRRLRLTHTGETNRHASWSPGGDAIYFVSNRSGSSNVYKLAINPETGQRVGEVESVTSFHDTDAFYPSVIEQTDALLFVLSKTTNTIHSAPASELGAARVHVRGLEPVLSPDGSEIYYAGETPSTQGVHVLNRRTQAQRLLADDVPLVGFLQRLQLSPDGETLAYFAEAEDGHALRLLSTDTGTASTLVTVETREELNPTWSPGGRQLAYASNGGLFVIDAAGGSPEEVARVTDWDSWNIAWSPDGRYIAGLGWTESGHGYSNDVFAVRVAGRDLIRLTSSATYKEGLTWHPDARRITYFSYGNESEPAGNRIVSVEDPHPHVLFQHDAGWEYVGTWDPAGRYFYFTSAVADATWRTFTYDIVTDTIEPTPIRGYVPHWSADGEWAVWCREERTHQLWLMTLQE